MRRSPVLLPALALLAAALTAPAHAVASDVLVPTAHGGVAVREDPFLPPRTLTDLPPVPRGTASAAPAAARGAANARSVPGELRRLARAGALPRAQASTYAATYARARRTLRRLKGGPRRELRAVLANASAMARGGQLSASRTKGVMETVRRNAAWWAAGRPLAYGRRIHFRGSRLVWQSYPGQGIQIQWLGTFARMNQLFLATGFDTELGKMAREVRDYASKRAGGIAWEYLFRFGGGRPPWVSGIAQGTAIMALSRTAKRRDEGHWLGVAKAALGIFRTPPPSGVRIRTGNGAHYLAYSYAPGQRIFNAFFQAIAGLHDFSIYANDALGRDLYLAGERQGRRELRQADSGSWTYYQPGVLSDMNYHKVLRDFVKGLCQRLNHDREREAIELRERRGPTAILHRLDRWPDPGPWCVATQKFNQYLYARLGRPFPAGG